MKNTHILAFLLITCITTFSQSGSKDTIQWSPVKQLAWTDFKGTMPDTAVTDGHAEIKILASSKKPEKYTLSNSYVVTVFNFNNSWAKPGKQTDTTLKYYQVMFDIGELYSRKLRKAIKETELDPYPVTFAEKIKAAQIGQADRIKQFKKETKSGTFHIAIIRWHDNVKAELTELNAFKQAPVKAK